VLLRTCPECLSDDHKLSALFLGSRFEGLDFLNLLLLHVEGPQRGDYMIHDRVVPALESQFYQRQISILDWEFKHRIQDLTDDAVTTFLCCQHAATKQTCPIALAQHKIVQFTCVCVVIMRQL